MGPASLLNEINVQLGKLYMKSSILYDMLANCHEFYSIHTVWDLKICTSQTGKQGYLIIAKGNVPPHI